MNTFIVGGVSMELPIMLGGGEAKHPSKLNSYLRPDIPVGAVETGSYTPYPRDGNLETPQQWPVTWEEFLHQKFGLNGWGMPNIGFKALVAELNKLPCTKPVILNIAGFGSRDYATGLHLANQTAVSALTLNFGCPNAHDAKDKPISYDLDSLQKTLDHIEGISVEKPIWIKLSPYITLDEYYELKEKFPELDFSHTATLEDSELEEILDTIAECSLVRAIIFSNTLPNVIHRDQNQEPVTRPNNGKAGLSGPLLKPISIGLIQKARPFLRNDIDLIGCGGILSGQDVIDYLKAGAKGVQCVSGPSWYGNGPRWFANLIQDSPELQDYLTTLTE